MDYDVGISKDKDGSLSIDLNGNVTEELLSSMGKTLIEVAEQLKTFRNEAQEHFRGVLQEVQEHFQEKDIFITTLCHKCGKPIQKGEVVAVIEGEIFHTDCIGGGA